MNLKNMIWLGEVVLHNGQNATVVGIELPAIFINTGKETLEVRFAELRKINGNRMIDIRNN